MNKTNDLAHIRSGQFLHDAQSYLDDIVDKLMKLNTKLLSEVDELIKEYTKIEPIKI